MKKAACLLLVFAMILSSVFVFCGCGDNSSTYKKSDEQRIREKVEFWGNYYEYKSKTIGGNELKSAQTHVTNLKKVSDKEYEVSGRIVMYDIYGDGWQNTFDCTATLWGDEWAISSFTYTSNSWTKK